MQIAKRKSEVDKKNADLARQYEGMAETFPNYSPEQIKLMHGSVAKGTTVNEFWLFLNIAHKQDLNPFTKEIWCYKDNKQNLIIFASKDGFLKKAQAHPEYNGIRSSEVRANDEIEIDVANAQVKHKITSLSNKDRGPVTGAYAIAYRKNAEPTVETASFSTYNKGYNVWRSHPEEMIKKVAETHALKKAFGITGVYAEEEFGHGNGSSMGVIDEKPQVPESQPALEAETTSKDRTVYNAMKEKIEKAQTEYTVTQAEKGLTKQLDLNLLTPHEGKELQEMINSKTAELSKLKKKKS